MNKSKKKRVFVLGAGFSKSLISDMPLINDFFSKNNKDIVKKEIKKRDQENKFAKLFMFIENNYQFFGNSKEDFDVEKLASFLTSYAFASSQEKKWEFEKLRNDLKSYINHLVKYLSKTKITRRLSFLTL